MSHENATEHAQGVQKEKKWEGLNCCKGAHSGISKRAWLKYRELQKVNGMKKIVSQREGGNTRRKKYGLMRIKKNSWDNQRKPTKP